MAYYDTDLDTTWLADAHLAASNSFGLPVAEPDRNGRAPVGSILTDGRMYWPDALRWIDGMNAATYLGFSDWRLPANSPINGSAFNSAFTNNATSDLGYANSEGWVDDAGIPVSEMGHLFYVTLGNTGSCPPNDASPGTMCPAQRDPQRNHGPFTGIQPTAYWSGSVFDSGNAWNFDFSSGFQGLGSSAGDHGSGGRRGGPIVPGGVYLHTWAVRDGDVSAVPAPAAIWLFGSGLLTFLSVPRLRGKFTRLRGMI
jgi:hypothetical protein